MLLYVENTGKHVLGEKQADLPVFVHTVSFQPTDHIIPLGGASDQLPSGLLDWFTIQFTNIVIFVNLCGIITGGLSKHWHITLSYESTEMYGNIEINVVVFNINITRLPQR